MICLINQSKVYPVPMERKYKFGKWPKLVLLDVKLYLEKGHTNAQTSSCISDNQGCKGEVWKMLTISKKLSPIIKSKCKAAKYVSMSLVFYSSSLTLVFHSFQEICFQLIQVLFLEINTCFTNIYRALLCRMCHCLKVILVTWYLLQSYF